MLQLATRIPAELLGLESEIGTVEIGKCADLVVLRDDPPTVPPAYRTVLWTIRGAMARQPEEWMHLPGW